MESELPTSPKDGWLDLILTPLEAKYPTRNLHSDIEIKYMYGVFCFEWIS